MKRAKGAGEAIPERGKFCRHVQPLGCFKNP